MRRVKLPIWAYRLLYWEKRLQLMLDNLEGVPDSYLTGLMLRNLGIEMHELDFWSGATCRSAFPFFAPAIDSRCKISTTLRDPDDLGQDDFTLYRRMRRDGINVRYGLQFHLAKAFRLYAEALDAAGQPGTEPSKEWKPVPTCAEARAALRSAQGDPYTWDVVRTRQVFSKRRTHRLADGFTPVSELLKNNQSHRQVWMFSDDYPVEERPTVSELLVLTSWMLAAVNTQRKLTASRVRRDHFRPHFVFPTLIVSFLPRAQARVLYGYFDDKTFKIQMTKLQEFDVSHYVDMMDALLKWACPRASSQTRRVIPPPTIPESSAEDEIPVEVIEKKSFFSKWLSRIGHRACARKKVVRKAAAHVCEYPIPVGD